MQVDEMAVQRIKNRLDDGAIIVRNNRVHPVVGLVDNYVVEGNGNMYLTGPKACTCPDFVHRGNELVRRCKHMWAVLLYQEFQDQ